MIGMGYYIYYEGGDVRISKGNVPHAINALRTLLEEESFLHCKKPDLDDLESMLWHYGFECDFDDEGNVVNIMWAGDKSRNEDECLAAIAPFVDPGSYMYMSGEEHEHWKWTFKDGQLEDVGATMVYNDENPLTNIDWNLLRKQKRRLTFIQEYRDLTREEKKSVKGILNLLDSIQDAAVTTSLFSEEQVFGAEDDA